MIPTQIDLTDEQLEVLRKLADERQMGVSELITEAIEHLLRSSAEPGWEERKRRALEAVGRFRSGLKDVSSRHDHYLTEAFDT
jgi:post-segregation antitoxin (ccd killing protein)